MDALFPCDVFAILLYGRPINYERINIYEFIV